MSDDYTPTDRDVEVAHIENRWLVEHDRQVAEKAWDAGHRHCFHVENPNNPIKGNPYQSTALQDVQEESKA